MRLQGRPRWEAPFPAEAPPRTFHAHLARAVLRPPRLSPACAVSHQLVQCAKQLSGHGPHPRAGRRETVSLPMSQFLLHLLPTRGTSSNPGPGRVSPETPTPGSSAPEMRTQRHRLGEAGWRASGRGGSPPRGHDTEGQKRLPRPPGCREEVPHTGLAPEGA